jgi:hypothetical protein
MTTRFDHAIRSAAATLLLITLAACEKPPPSEVPAPSPAPTESMPDAAPVPAPTEETPPVDTPAAPTQPESTPPPPEEPSAVPKPTAALVGPDLESMQVARPSAKLGVAVDLRYRFDTEPVPGQPVTRPTRPRQQPQGQRQARRGRAIRWCRAAARAESHAGGRLSPAVLGDAGSRRGAEPARDGHHGHGRRHRLRLLLDPVRGRTHRSEIGFSQTTLIPRRAGRVNYAP